MTTGVDWSRLADNLPPVDPYLVWAETTAYADYRLNAGKSPEGWWPVLLELAPAEGGVSPVDRLLAQSDRSWLQVPAAYQQPALGADFRYCTARVTGRFFTDDASRKQAGVLRYQLGLPVERTVGQLHDPDQPSTGDPTDAQPLSGGEHRTVMALIDGGLAFAHAAFCRQTGGVRQARVKRYWRQDEYFGSRYLGDVARTSCMHSGTSGWHKTTQMGYGQQLDGAAIQAAIDRHSHAGQVDEDALYRELELWSLDNAAHHGTHVFSLATQPYAERLTAEDDPPQLSNDDTRLASGTCDLIAVQLEWANVLDTSGRAMAVNVFDALAYVVSCCADSVRRIVVNLSWGTQAGPHDGTSVLDKAIQALCAAPGLKDRLFIVVPAGNHYQARSHAHAVLYTQPSLELSWRIQPDGHTPSFLELWFRGDPDQGDPLSGVSVRVTPPGGVAQTVLPGQWRTLHAGTATAVFPRHTMLGDNGTCMLIVVAPTASLAGATVAPSGVWKVEVDYAPKVHGPPLYVDAFIERNDVAMGLFTGARPSYFEAEGYNLGFSEDMPIGGDIDLSDVRRCGSYSSLATGTDDRQWLDVGGLVHLPSERKAWEKPAAYSPRFNDVLTPPPYPSEKHVPNRAMVTDESGVLQGMRAAGSRSGGTVRLVGTSSAVPQLVRILANDQLLPDMPRPPKKHDPGQDI